MPDASEVSEFIEVSKFRNVTASCEVSQCREFLIVMRYHSILWCLNAVSDRVS